MGGAVRLCTAQQEEEISTKFSLTEYAVLLGDMKGLEVEINDGGTPTEAIGQHATNSIRPCVISDFPGRAVATNMLHVIQQVYEKRIGGERRRVANQ